MENHSYAQIHGSSSATYINSLMAQYGNATNMRAENHPSAPNYVAMTNGSNGSCCTDDGYHQLTGNRSSRSFRGGQSRSLMRSMPGACDAGNSGNYAIRHNPMPYYNDVRASGDCANYDLPLGSTPDLSAKFAFISPDTCHDMPSNPCSGSSNVILLGDNELKSLLPLLLAAPQYQAGNTAIFITWDENDGSSGNQIPPIVIPSATPAGACEATSYSHDSMLRYVEDNFGVPDLLAAAPATKMDGCFGL